MTGLYNLGIDRPTEAVNLCILRGQHWAFRRGSVDLTWIPNMKSMRTGSQREDIKRVMDNIINKDNKIEL